MTAVIGVLSDVSLDGVLDTKGLAGVVFTWLKSDRAWRVWWEGKGEGKGVSSEFLDELLLNRCQLILFVTLGRRNLLLREDHLLAELEPHDFILLSTEPVGGRYLRT